VLTTLGFWFYLKFGFHKIYRNENVTLFILFSGVLSISNNEVKNVLKVIIIQKANIKSGVGQHGPRTKAKVGSGAMED
jgi:hypothetical protein